MARMKLGSTPKSDLEDAELQSETSLNIMKQHGEHQAHLGEGVWLTPGFSQAQLLTTAHSFTENS